jgi:hypothetical protein
MYFDLGLILVKTMGGSSSQVAGQEKSKTGGETPLELRTNLG